MALVIVSFMLLCMVVSLRLFRLVLPDSLELKWSWPQVRLIIWMPFLPFFTLKRLAVALCVFAFGINLFIAPSLRQRTDEPFGSRAGQPLADICLWSYLDVKT